MNPGNISEERPAGGQELQRGCGVYASRIHSVYFPTVEATVNAAVDLRSGSYREPDSLFEVPADQYQATIRKISDLMDGSGPDAPTRELEVTRRLKRGAVSYKQAMRLARAGCIDGVGLDAETRAVRCAFPYGLSFALDHARARWVGGSERAAVAMALRASLRAGPDSPVHGLLAARLAPTEKASTKSARNRGALYGVAGSALAQGARDATGRAFPSISSPAATGQFVLFACAGPLVSTVATGVGNLDFYRVALERSISWPQFTKNMVVQTTGVVAGVGGWAGGAVVGAAIGGPLCALIGSITGALSAGGLGAVGAKRIADRYVEDDATRMMVIVRQSSEQLAFQYLLSAAEIDRFAARIQTLVDAAWLRRMFRSGRLATKSGGNGNKAMRRFAERELDRVCKGIVRRRKPVVLPNAGVVNGLLEETGLLEAGDRTAAGAHSTLRAPQSGAKL